MDGANNRKMTDFFPVSKKNNNHQRPETNNDDNDYEDERAVDNGWALDWDERDAQELEMADKMSNNSDENTDNNDNVSRNGNKGFPSRKRQPPDQELQWQANDLRIQEFEKLLKKDPFRCSLMPLDGISNEKMIFYLKSVYKHAIAMERTEILELKKLQKFQSSQSSSRKKPNKRTNSQPQEGPKTIATRHELNRKHARERISEIMYICRLNASKSRMRIEDEKSNCWNVTFLAFCCVAQIRAYLGEGSRYLEMGICAKDIGLDAMAMSYCSTEKPLMTLSQRELRLTLYGMVGVWRTTHYTKDIRLLHYILCVRLGELVTQNCPGNVMDDCNKLYRCTVNDPMDELLAHAERLKKEELRGKLPVQTKPADPSAVAASSSSSTKLSVTSTNTNPSQEVITYCATEKYIQHCMHMLLGMDDCLQFFAEPRLYWDVQYTVGKFLEKVYYWKNSLGNFYNRKFRSANAKSPSNDALVPLPSSTFPSPKTKEAILQFLVELQRQKKLQEIMGGLLRLKIRFINASNQGTWSDNSFENWGNAIEKLCNEMKIRKKSGKKRKGHIRRQVPKQVPMQNLTPMEEAFQELKPKRNTQSNNRKDTPHQDVEDEDAYDEDDDSEGNDHDSNDDECNDFVNGNRKMFTNRFQKIQKNIRDEVLGFSFETSHLANDDDNDDDDEQQQQQQRPLNFSSGNWFMDRLDSNALLAQANMLIPTESGKDCIEIEQSVRLWVAGLMSAHSGEEQIRKIMDSFTVTDLRPGEIGLHTIEFKKIAKYPRNIWQTQRMQSRSLYVTVNHLDEFMEQMFAIRKNALNAYLARMKERKNLAELHAIRCNKATSSHKPNTPSDSGSQFSSPQHDVLVPENHGGDVRIFQKLLLKDLPTQTYVTEAIATSLLDPQQYGRALVAETMLHMINYWTLQTRNFSWIEHFVLYEQCLLRRKNMLRNNRNPTIVQTMGEFNVQYQKQLIRCWSIEMAIFMCIFIVLVIHQGQFFDLGKTSHEHTGGGTNTGTDHTNEDENNMQFLWPIFLRLCPSSLLKFLSENNLIPSLTEETGAHGGGGGARGKTFSEKQGISLDKSIYGNYNETMQKYLNKMERLWNIEHGNLQADVKMKNDKEENDDNNNDESVEDSDDDDAPIKVFKSVES